MGQNYVAVDVVKKIISAWLETDFSTEERHIRRVSKVDKI